MSTTHSTLNGYYSIQRLRSDPCLVLSDGELRQLFAVLDQVGDINRDAKSDCILGSRWARELADRLAGEFTEELEGTHWWAHLAEAGEIDQGRIY